MTASSPQVAAAHAALEQAPARAARTLFGHPAALTVLFLAGMWEIFALVGMRAVLVYYLVGPLRYSEAQAVQIYGYSTAAAFFTALIGGALADRYLGIWRGSLLGAFLMALGHFMLASPPLLFPALAVIALGNGLFKPTMLAQVSLLYATEDPRRERAYNVYAVGCNLGATIAPLVCGAVGQAFGWNWAFVATAVGMLISAATLIAGRSFLPLRESQWGKQAAAEPQVAASRNSLRVLAVAWIAAVFFWAAYGQIGGAVALWAQNDVDRTVQIGEAFVIPAAWFQSLNPLLIFVLAPALNWVWARDHRAVSQDRNMKKMAIGGVLLAVAFAVFAGAAALPRNEAGVDPLWVVLAIVPFTLGELYLNTIGQSMFSRLAPKKLVSVFMGVWILTLMLGHVVTGWLGRVWALLTPPEFFALVAGIALTSAFILMIARPVLSQGVAMRTARSD